MVSLGCKLLSRHFSPQSCVEVASVRLPLVFVLESGLMGASAALEVY